jgi:hypothetical protein
VGRVECSASAASSMVDYLVINLVVDLDSSRLLI